MLPEKWTDMLDERQRKEVELCRIYAKDFHHGTDGHNSKMIIDAMATFLDYWYQPQRDYPGNQQQYDRNAPGYIGYDGGPGPGPGE